MNSFPSPAVLPGRTGPRLSPVLAAVVLTGLILLPATPVRANQTAYDFSSEFVGGSIVKHLAQPYYDADPDSFYMPVMTGSMNLKVPLIDLFPSDPSHGYYVDTSGTNSLSFQVGGEQFSFAGNLTFDTYKDGSSFLSVYNDSYRLNFLFYDANFTSDSSNNLLFLSTAGGESDIDLWTLAALGGGNAYSDKAVDIWHTAPLAAKLALLREGGGNREVRPFDQVAATTLAVPDSLSLLGFIAPLALAALVHRRSRRHRSFSPVL